MPSAADRNDKNLPAARPHPAADSEASPGDKPGDDDATELSSAQPDTGKRPEPDTTETPVFSRLHRRYDRTRRLRDPSVSVSGNSVGGDMIIEFTVHDDAKGRDETAEVIARLEPLPKPPFVPPPFYVELRKALIENDVVVIRGDKRCGRRTAAIHMLAATKGGVCELNPSITVDKFIDLEPPRNMGFLLDRTDTTGPLSTYEITVIEAAVRGAACKLVILTAATAAYAVAHPVTAKTGPNGVDVLCAWLDRLSDGDGRHDQTALRSRLAADGITIVVGDAESIANQIASSTVDDALSWHEAQARDNVAQHIIDLLAHADERDAALYVATLVLTGSPEATIAAAANDLADRLVELANKEPEPRPLFERPLTARLMHLNLCRTDGLASGVADTPTPTLTLTDPTLGEAYLQHLWFEYGLEAVLTSWLSDIAASSFDAAVHAGFAIAHLLARSAHSVTADIVCPWAADDDPYLRFAAALALGLSALDSTENQAFLIGAIQAMSAADDWHTRWTAATAVGFGVGQRFPRVALAVFDRLADANPPLLTRASNSLESIFRSMIADDAHLAGIAQLLSTWIERPPRPTRRSRIVCDATAAIVDQPDDAFARLERAGLPLCQLIGTLLDIQNTRSDAQQMVATLLRSLPDTTTDIDVTEIIRRLGPGERGPGRLEFLLRRLTNHKDRRVRDEAQRFHQLLGAT